MLGRDGRVDGVVVARRDLSRRGRKTGRARKGAPQEPGRPDFLRFVMSVGGPKTKTQAPQRLRFPAAWERTRERRAVPWRARRSSAAKAGVSFGTALSIVISWSQHESILWAIFHGVLSWLYVIWHVLTR